MASDPHFAKVKFLSHFDGTDEAVTARDLSPSGHTLTFAGDAELDTAQKKWGTASLLHSVPGFPFVVLLVAFDGVDATTSFTDDSATVHTLAAVNAAQVDTAQSKFGGASGLFDDVAASEDHITVADTLSDFTFGTGDYTVEAWIRWNTGGTIDGNSGAIFFTNGGGGTSQWLLRMTSSGRLQFWWNAGKQLEYIPGTPDLSDGNWYHVAICRVAGTTTMYVSGTSRASTATVMDVALTANNPLIGMGGASPNTDGMTGWIDELRVTKGIGQYTANFTPHTSAHPRS